MSDFKLARLQWSMGQTLLPDHLVVQEDAVLAEIRLRAALQGVPAYGVAQLTWNEALLATGTLDLLSLTLIMPSGLLLDLPGNVVLPALSLNALGRSRLSIYLHLLQEPGSTKGNRLYEGDPKGIRRVVHKTELSSEPMLDGSVEAMKLLEMEQDINGAWVTSGTYLPPLLSVGRSPFLQAALGDLEQALSTFRATLILQLSDNFLGAGRLVSVRRCLVAVFRVQSLLGDLKNQIHPHPYVLFEALRTLSFELSCFRDVLPDEEIPLYRHDDLGRVYGALLQSLQRSLHPLGTRSKHVPIPKKDGLFYLSPLPAEVAGAQEVYLLIKRAGVYDHISLEGVKLASPSRLAMVYQLALKGIPYKYVERPVFPHSFGPEVDFYLLAVGEEWEHALKEGGLAFYALPALQKNQVSLFWRYA